MWFDVDELKHGDLRWLCYFTLTKWGFVKWGCPQIIHFNRILQIFPLQTIHFGVSPFVETPKGSIVQVFPLNYQPARIGQRTALHLPWPNHHLQHLGLLMAVAVLSWHQILFSMGKHAGKPSNYEHSKSEKA